MTTEEWENALLAIGLLLAISIAWDMDDIAKALKRMSGDD